MKLKYLGHSAFLIDNRILIDPWISNPLYKGKPEEFKDVKLILVTHGHGDHVGDALEIARISGAKIVSIYELGNLLESEGVKTIKMNIGGTIEWEDYLIKMVPAIHSNSYKGRYAGMPAGFLIETPDGIRIYHAGDTDVFCEMKFIKTDIALLPIGGYYTMDIFDALKAVELIKPRIVIPMHYNTFPEIETDPEVFVDKVLELGVDATVLKPGEEFSEEVEYEE